MSATGDGIFSTADIVRAAFAAATFGGAALLLTQGKAPISALGIECGCQFAGSIASDIAFTMLAMPHSAIASPLAAAGVALGIKYAAFNTPPTIKQIGASVGAQFGSEFVTGWFFPTA
jgi:hypothetical protein